MKKKTLLLIIAAVLVVSIAIGGTLMLFTAYTHTATNVVKLSSGIDIITQELGGHLNPVDGTAITSGTEYQGTYKDIDTSWGGLELTALQPKEVIAKQPRVRNAENSENAYIKVTVDFADFADNFDLVAADFLITDYLKTFTGTSSQNITNWTWFQDTTTKTLYTAYYTTGGTLTALAPNTATAELFTNVKVPDIDLEGYDSDNEISGEIEIIAYAVQADWNTPDTSSLSGQAVYEAYFPTPEA
ncbi:MAG: hypothetical protein LBN30_06255 [Oscillospiraceae bacterium]|jgi:predicted ribosomally synthesized peptide with SipW-like signal peptide|nr:hypothetical protein [Oscillospiraceae bacterium]